MNTKINYKIIYGQEIEKYIEELAALRIEIFYDFPYLYEGEMDYEKKYLKVYSQSKRSILVAAFDNDLMIGAATAMPLVDEADYVKKPFLDNGININDIYYFGESVLKKAYRGIGIGHEFFNGRESAAKKFGFKVNAFCAVKRAEDHPLRPIDYSPLDSFWNKRGYKKNDSLVAHFSWKDRGQTSESEKPMVYWMKDEN